MPFLWPWGGLHAVACSFCSAVVCSSLRPTFHTVRASLQPRASLARASLQPGQACSQGKPAARASLQPRSLSHVCKRCQSRPAGMDSSTSLCSFKSCFVACWHPPVAWGDVPALCCAVAAVNTRMTTPSRIVMSIAAAAESPRTWVAGHYPNRSP